MTVILQTTVGRKYVNVFVQWTVSLSCSRILLRIWERRHRINGRGFSVIRVQSRIKYCRLLLFSNSSQPIQKKSNMNFTRINTCSRRIHLSRSLFLNLIIRVFKKKLSFNQCILVLTVQFHFYNLAVTWRREDVVMLMF